MSPVQYASTINIGVLDGQYLILLLMLQHSGMANTNIRDGSCLVREESKEMEMFLISAGEAVF